MGGGPPKFKHKLHTVLGLRPLVGLSFERVDLGDSYFVIPGVPDMDDLLAGLLVVC